MRRNNRDDLLHPSFTHFENFIIFGGLTQSNIYDETFIAKIGSRWVYSKNSSIVDARLGSKYASAFWRLFKRFISLKYLT